MCSIGSTLKFSSEEYNETNFNDKFKSYKNMKITDPTNELREVSGNDSFVISKFQTSRTKGSTNKTNKVNKQVKRTK